MHNENEVKPQPMPQDPNMRFRVTIKWNKGLPEVLIDVSGFALENDVYFFYQDSEEMLSQSTIRPVWLKHQNMRSLEITPYLKAG